jgi:hypothetical protein
MHTLRQSQPAGVFSRVTQLKQLPTPHGRFDHGSIG